MSLGVPSWVRVMLRCPNCKGDLVDRADQAEDGRTGWLDCRSCALAYPVMRGEPWLVAECAVRR